MFVDDFGGRILSFGSDATLASPDTPPRWAPKVAEEVRHAVERISPAFRPNILACSTKS